MKKTFILILAFASFVAIAQNDSKLGKPAPDLSFATILNSSSISSAKLSDFKQKVVVLEFWASWCAPCIESFSHLEKLQLTYSKDLQILAVTDESEERINMFLAKKKTSLPVVIDKERKTAGEFQHRSIPHTVVIDKNGIVRLITTPSELTEDIIAKMIANQKVSLPEKKDVMDFDSSRPLSGNENFTYQVMVTPYQEGLPSMSNSTGGKGGYANRRILAINLSPKTLYEIAYQFPVGRRTIVEVKDRTHFDWNKQNAICFDLIVPESMGDQRFEIMKQHLKILFPYRVEIEKRNRSSKVLKPIGSEKIKLQPSTGGEKNISMSASGLSMKNSEAAAIIRFLEDQLDVPVIDETGLTGLYDLELPWYAESPELIHQTLKKIGLELTEVTRDIDVLVIYDKSVAE